MSAQGPPALGPPPSAGAPAPGANAPALPAETQNQAITAALADLGSVPTFPKGFQGEPLEGIAPHAADTQAAPEVELEEGEVLLSEEQERAWISGWVRSTYHAEKDARALQERQWEENLRLLMNEHDWSGKADWQSQIVISKVPNAVSAQMAILKAGLVQMSGWWNLEASADPDDEILATYFKKLLGAELAERDPTTKRDFLDEWLLGLKGAQISSRLVMKFYPVLEHKKVRVMHLVPDEGPEEEPAAPGGAVEGLAERLGIAAGAAAQAEAELASKPKRRMASRMETRPEVRIAKELVSPWDFVRDSTGRGKYDIQMISGDADDLLFLPEESGYRKEWLQEARDKCSSRIPRKESEERTRSDEQSVLQPQRLTYEGYEFYGNVLGPDGVVLYRDHVVTVIEDVVVRLEPIPFDDGATYSVGEVEPMPYKHYGRCPVDNVSGIARAITELTNAVIDASAYEVLSAFEVDLAQASSETDITTGIYPGKTILKRDRMGTGQPMIRRVEVGRIPPDVPNLLVHLDRLFQEGTNVTELSQGMGPVRGFPTATETQARQQNSHQAFRAEAQWMEKSSLEPCIAFIFSRMVQFKILAEGGMEWCAKVLGAEEAARFYETLYTRVERDGTFELNYDFKVDALSTILAKAAELERLTTLLQAVQQFPGLANRLNLDELSKRVISVLGFSSDKLVKSPQELAEVAAMEKVARERLAAGIGEQPRSNSGLTAAGAATVTPSGT